MSHESIHHCCGIFGTVSSDGTVMTSKSLIEMLVTSPFLSIFVLFLLGISLPSAQGWKQCPGGGVCPDYATCCPSAIPGNPPACISARHGKDPENATGVCCDETTGCPYGFSCGVRTMSSTSSSSDDDESLTPDEMRTKNGSDGFKTEQSDHLYCKIDAENPPVDLFHNQPRYEMCRIPDPAMTILHGFPIVPISSNYRNKRKRRLSSPDTNQLAYYSSHGDLLRLNSHDDNEIDEGVSVNNAMIEKVLIMIHGSGRSAEDYFCAALSLVPKAERDRVLVIAPEFLAPDDVANTTTFLIWQEDEAPPKYPMAHSWRYGADALSAPVGSYAAIDGIVEYLLSSSSENGQRLFPNLKQISIAGHSAGGQVVHRWALLSKISSNQVEIRVVAANPRSYCYLDGRRMIFHSATNTSGWEYPSARELEHCPDYNQWNWGLEQGGALDPVVPYFVRRLEETTPKELAIAYAVRKVTYLTGEYDVIPQKDQCATYELQGTNRHERALHYFAALKAFFEANGGAEQLHHYLHTIPESPHDHFLMFQSVAGRQAIFGSSDHQDTSAAWSIL